MNRRHQVVRPIRPVNPQYHAQAAHPQPVVAPAPAQVPPMPQVAPTVAASRRQIKISKNVIIGILLVLLVGAGGALSDRDHEIAGLKTKISSTQPAKVSEATDLANAIKLCAKVAARGSEIDCITQVMAGH